MKSCDALLFFLDITEPEAAIRERLNELGLMLAKLRELTADGNTITRPLALVLTKWDTRPDFDASRADASTEFEKACQFLHDGSAYGQFFSTLEQSGDRVREPL